MTIVMKVFPTDSHLISENIKTGAAYFFISALYGLILLIYAARTNKRLPK